MQFSSHVHQNTVDKKWSLQTHHNFDRNIFFVFRMTFPRNHNIRSQTGYVVGKLMNALASIYTFSVLQPKCFVF